jgi:Apea-like HEPN
VAVTDASLFADVFNCLTAVASWPEAERHSYELAHNRFSQTYDRVHDEDRLIDSWIGFETLFLPKQDEGELSYRAQMRIARFVGNDLAEREQIRDKLRQPYRMRSNIVHGAPANKRKPDQVTARTRETMEILRLALRKWVDPHTDRTGEALDRALLS